ncbi:MAG: 2OG-Fe(II) oxygenase family protein [bacterium]
MNIPHLDLQHLDPVGLDQACARWGFFKLTGHQIPKPLSEELMAQTYRFFQQTSEQKRSIARTAENSWGYFDAELTKNRRDWKEILDIGPAVLSGPLAGSMPQWPDLAGFKETMLAIEKHLHTIALELVSSITAGLGSDEDLTSAFVDHSSFLRLNYYPPCPDPAPADADFFPQRGELGISHHTDAGALTVLLQDQQPGLQVYSGNRWHTVQPSEDALIINIGDIVQVWSNDKYKAPLHRVLANAEQPRISTPYFLNPSYDYHYAPLAATLIQDQPRYNAINWGYFRAQRSQGDYADHGEEIQISNFRR